MARYQVFFFPLIVFFNYIGKTFFKLNLFNMFFVVRHVVVIFVSYGLYNSCPRTVKRLLTADYLFNIVDSWH